VIPKPNTIQKLLHRLVMLRPVSAFFAPRVHQIDKAILKLTKGQYTASEILGWNIVQLTSIGARTGQPRSMPLIGLFDGKKIALVASSFGRDHNPGWYYNLKAHSECEIEFHGHSGKYVAREIWGEEYEHYWQLALSYYAGYEKYRQRAAPRHIPVMVLEPKT
jgi:deazaflavin-dependent oxidoreductase (nitroreductase family)